MKEVGRVLVTHGLKSVSGAPYGFHGNGIFCLCFIFRYNNTVKLVKNSNYYNSTININVHPS